jgi:hypothetical protein
LLAVLGECIRELWPWPLPGSNALPKVLSHFVSGVVELLLNVGATAPRRGVMVRNVGALRR